MNIVFVEGNLDGTVGGSHHCLLEIVNNLDASEFESHVVFYHLHSLVEHFSKSCQVHFVENPPGLNFEQKFPHLNSLFARLLRPVQRGWNFIFYSVPLFFRARHLLSQTGANVVHINNAPTPNVWLLAAQSLGIPVTAHLRGFWMPTSFQQFWVKRYRKIFAISHAVVELLEQHQRFPNAIVIHDGIDASHIIERANVTCQTPVTTAESKQPILVLAGNITRWKGQHVACEAIQLLRSQYPKIQLHIIGAVSLNPDDQLYLAELNNFTVLNDLEHHIQFHGYIDNVPAWMKRADIVLHTSKDPEPLGRVILEAMSLGKSIIASNRGGPGEIIINRVSGLLIPPDNPQALAEAIASICEDPSLRETLEREALVRVTSAFKLSDKLNCYQAYWRDVL